MTTVDEAATLDETDRCLLGRVKDIIMGVLPAAEVLLYGSVARGTRDENSDYDVLVLTDRTIPRTEQRHLRGQVLDVELDCDNVISLLFCQKQQWTLPKTQASPFHKEVEKDAIML